MGNIVKSEPQILRRGDRDYRLPPGTKELGPGLFELPGMEELNEDFKIFEAQKAPTLAELIGVELDESYYDFPKIGRLYEVEIRYLDELLAIMYQLFKAQGQVVGFRRAYLENLFAKIYSQYQAALETYRHQMSQRALLIAEQKGSFFRAITQKLFEAGAIRTLPVDKALPPIPLKPSISLLVEHANTHCSGESPNPYKVAIQHLEGLGYITTVPAARVDANGTVHEGETKFNIYVPTRRLLRREAPDF